MWDLPKSVEIDGNKCPIRNDCDYRVVLDVIKALKDESLTPQKRIICALSIFYDSLTGIKDFQAAYEEMMKIVNLGELEDQQNESQIDPIMDWEHDFKQLAPPISRTLGYSVRDDTKYTHWYDFVGAYMEIGECLFANIVSIRNKIKKGKKLEKWEEDFYRENRKMIDLPLNLTSEEEEFLSSDW